MIFQIIPYLLAFFVPDWYESVLHGHVPVVRFLCFNDESNGFFRFLYTSEDTYSFQQYNKKIYVKQPILSGYVLLVERFSPLVKIEIWNDTIFKEIFPISVIDKTKIFF